MNHSIIKYLIMKTLNEDASIEDKKQQIARAKAYIENNPDDPDNSELYELIDKLEKEINGTSNAPDLNVLLDKARDIVRAILPEHFHVNLNDENRPSIEWGEIKGNTLGQCDSSTKPPHITISNYLKDFNEEQIMNTVIHELLHALPICRYSGHTGNWRALAQMVTAKTPYHISTYADKADASEFDNRRSSNKAHYTVTCNNCGTVSTFYKRARIIDHPENYHCARCGAKDYHIEYHPLTGATQIIKEYDVYQPGEREAMDGLFKHEQDTVRNALENAFPGSCPNFWISGSPMNWESKVPVITDESNKNKIISILADVYGVSKDKVKYTGTDQAKIRKTDVERRYSDNYIPYKTMTRLVFDVDWKETTNEDLKRYQDYIRTSMKKQGIQWESELLEGINKPVQDRIGNFALDVLVDRRYGNAKFTDIADIEVGPDYIDIAFDFDFKETETFNGLSGKPSKVIHPTPTEIEVTEKRIDKFMTEDFPTLFFRYYHVTPFFRIITDEHRWIDENSLACFYTIKQINERK